MTTEEKPVAELHTSVTPNGCHLYELYIGNKRIWLTHARATEVERDGARGRMQRWLALHPHKLVMTGPKLPVASSPTDAQEIAFWNEFEPVLGGRNWPHVEDTLSRKQARPTTVAGWSKLFETVDQALRKSTA